MAVINTLVQPLERVPPRVTDLLARVDELLRQVSAEVIEPRFRTLGCHDVRTKSPGEVVTIADEEAEHRLTARLRQLLPGTPVVGEEACAANPALLSAGNEERSWLVDPLDGTANFVAGRPDWAVMVALTERGRTVASWIWRPIRGVMYVAERGQGATRNGASFRRRAPAPAPIDMRGAVSTRFLDERTSRVVAANGHRFRTVDGGTLSAGVDYPRLIEGDLDFALYWRTLPWDHAPGTLLVEEAGGAAARPDGRPYRPHDAGVGLLAVADRGTWAAVKLNLLGADGAAVTET